MSNAAGGLIAELEELITARLVLVLLPTQTALARKGEHELANTIAVGVRDIGMNVARIVSRYEVHSKRR